MAVSYELATPQSEREIVALMREFYSQFEDLHFDEVRSPAGVRALLASPEQGLIWLFSSNGVAVGYLALTFGFSLEFCGRITWIDELYVQAPFRGRGIGVAAMDRAIGYCKELGFKGIMLELDRVNLEAERFYERLGFSERKQYRTLAISL